MFQMMLCTRNVSIGLQKEEFDKAGVRLPFDAMFRKVPLLDPTNKYLCLIDRIMESTHFRNGGLKILERRENELLQPNVL